MGTYYCQVGYGVSNSRIQNKLDFVFNRNIQGKVCIFEIAYSEAQCARMDLNKRFLPKPMTTTG